jgi:glycosyltransferase involved in cell wall biosynthesis
MFVLSWPPTGVGGVNETVLNLGLQLKLHSRLSPLIAVTSWCPIALPEQVRGIPVIGVQVHDGYAMGPWAAVKSAAWLPAELPALARALKVHDVEIVNVHFPSLAGAVFLLLRWLGLYGGKVALTFHGSDIRSAAGAASPARLAWKHFIRGADAVFVCSKALAATAEQLAPGARVQVIYPGTEMELFSRGAKRTGVDQKNILHIGKFEEKKSQDVLLEAFQQLLDRGIDCTLTMIGAAGPTLEQVKRAAASFGERVRLLVDIQHDQIPAYMAVADLFVLPSRAEGFGIVLLEAGAAGLPVVATKVGGIPEIITDGVSGLLVEPDDPHALADAMAKIFQSPGLAASVASALRAHVERYTWDRAAKDFLAALDCPQRAADTARDS